MPLHILIYDTSSSSTESMSRRSRANKKALDEARKKKQLQRLKQQKKVNRARAKIRKRRQRDMKKPTATDSAAVFEECKSSFEKIIGTGVSDAKIRFCLEKRYDPMKAVQLYFTSQKTIQTMWKNCL